MHHTANLPKQVLLYLLRRLLFGRNHPDSVQQCPCEAPVLQERGEEWEPAFDLGDQSGAGGRDCECGEACDSRGEGDSLGTGVWDKGEGVHALRFE